MEKRRKQKRTKTKSTARDLSACQLPKKESVLKERRTNKKKKKKKTAAQVDEQPKSHEVKLANLKGICDGVGDAFSDFLVQLQPVHGNGNGCVRFWITECSAATKAHMPEWAV